jgi:hypothetical protein
MSNSRQERQTKRAREAAAKAHDPLIVELVKLLARAAAERDYARLRRDNSEQKTGTRRGE